MGLFSGTSPIETAIIKATDENLTRENWQYIIDVVDQLNATSDAAKKQQAIAALKRRLDSRNANVQLYALTLLNALAHNTGYTVHREMVARPLLDTLFTLGTGAATHRTVKQRLLDILREISSEFASEPALAPMIDTYKRVAAANGQSTRGYQDGPAPAAPAAPHGHSRSGSASAPAQPRKPVSNAAASAPARGNDDELREQEEADLKRALELSLRESQANKPLPAEPAAAAATAPAAAATAPEQPEHSRVRALYDFAASEAGELAFRRGDVITVLESKYKDWWKGELRGAVGIFPLNYVEPVKDAPSAAADPAHDTDEAYVFAQARNVEKLLSIFASASQHPGYSIVTNDDVQKMYHEVMSLRPKLLQMIDEYSTKKERLMELNDQVASTRQSYERLLAARTAPQRYQRYNEHTPAALPGQAVPSPQASAPPQGYYQAPSQGQQAYAPSPQGQQAYTSPAQAPPAQASPTPAPAQAPLPTPSHAHSYAPSHAPSHTSSHAPYEQVASPQPPYAQAAASPHPPYGQTPASPHAPYPAQPSAPPAASWAPGAPAAPSQPPLHAYPTGSSADGWAPSPGRAPLPYPGDASRHSSVATAAPAEGPSAPPASAYGEYSYAT